MKLCAIFVFLNEVMFDSRMNKLCYSFNVWSVSIDKDCFEVFNTHFDYSA